MTPVNTLQELGEGKDGRKRKVGVMRLAKWCFIASVTILTAVLAGCYTPHSSTVWIPEKAKAAILKEEQSYVGGTGNITPESLQVTDDYFDNFYFASEH